MRRGADHGSLYGKQKDRESVRPVKWFHAFLLPALQEIIVMIPWVIVKNTEVIRMRKKQGWFILLTVVLSLAGCGGRVEKGEGLVPSKEQETEKKTELAVFYSGEDARRISVMEELCEKFMEENQDIRVLSEHSGSGIYSETLKAKEAAGEFPDIFEIQDPYTFAEAGKLGAISRRWESWWNSPLRLTEIYMRCPFTRPPSGLSIIR